MRKKSKEPQRRIRCYRATALIKVAHDNLVPGGWACARALTAVGVVVRLITVAVADGVQVSAVLHHIDSEVVVVYARGRRVDAGESDLSGTQVVVVIWDIKLGCHARA